MPLDAATAVARGPVLAPPPTSTTTHTTAAGAVRYPRNAVLQVPQIRKELASLQAALDRARAGIRKEDHKLVDAQRAAIAEMRETAREEVYVLEGVELAKAEDEQVVLLHGAQQDLKRYELLEHEAADAVARGEMVEEAGELSRGAASGVLVPAGVAAETEDEAENPILQITSELYRTSGHMPHRFNKPALWRYVIKGQHPLYSTTSNDYGKVHPSVHEMPHGFNGQSSKFTKHMNQAGPYRNFSLNTA
ncbi:hypothetical protein HDU87_005408 [Geranomyces variabilis]|uniref:Uncharacterized protein n=1 Tax=Geranomyces variabilis TaxID=109894 RepID=A0AAD5XP57_9FUNG|nr:hypothetical protein HDU87_005408 [Geranomyces variabilis]